MFWVVAVNENMLEIGFERGMTGFCDFFFLIFFFFIFDGGGMGYCEW